MSIKGLFLSFPHQFVWYTVLCHYLKKIHCHTVVVFDWLFSSVCFIIWQCIIY